MHVAVPADKYFYTSQGKNTSIDGVDDAKDLQSLKDAMKLLGEYSS